MKLTEISETERDKRNRKRSTKPTEINKTERATKLTEISETETETKQ
jgi:hypothetical protein